MSLRWSRDRERQNWFTAVGGSGTSYRIGRSPNVAKDQQWWVHYHTSGGHAWHSLGTRRTSFVAKELAEEYEAGR